MVCVIRCVGAIMNYFLIGLAAGGITTLLFIKSKNFVRRIKRASLTELENTRLKQENEQLKRKVLQNATDINDLKSIIPGIEFQVITCLELLGSITTIRNKEELAATYAATLRFRELWGLTEQDKNSDTYISGD